LQNSCKLWVTGRDWGVCVGWSYVAYLGTEHALGTGCGVYCNIRLAVRYRGSTDAFIASGQSKGNNRWFTCHRKKKLD
jgi:hypothetical protein